MSKITKHAKGMSCIRCGANDGTTCLRHYNGIRQAAYGKGRGIKCNDIAGAELCAKCDEIFTEGVISEYHDMLVARLEITKIIRSEDFLHWCMMTAIRREPKEKKKYSKPSKVVARNGSGFAL